MVDFFEIGSLELFATGWLQTGILLISASWIARITGMSQGLLAFPYTLNITFSTNIILINISIIWKTNSPCPWIKWTTGKIWDQEFTWLALLLTSYRILQN
jgi:hypothetical protein